MTEKLIIENRSGLAMDDVLPYINAVIKRARISNDGQEYCYLTSFKRPEDEDILMVASVKNKKSDRLVVYYQEMERK